MDGLIGQRLGQYEIIEQIGQGGMGTVYRAKQTSMGREVAIKVLPRSMMQTDPEYLERFYREVRLAAQLQHPHIVPVHDFGEQEGMPYIVMAHIGGGSLLDYIQQQGTMPISDVLRVTRQISSALEYAHHRGIVHRDLKPGNVLFDDDQNAYLADFGLAKMAGSGEITKSGAMMGTPEYMAPDWGSEGELSPSIDLYALGVMVYQMLAGEVPYKASTPMGTLMMHISSPLPDIIAVRDDLPSSVGMVVRKAMAKTANERYPSAAALLEALEAAIDRPDSERFKRALTNEGAYFIPNAWARLSFVSIEQMLGTEELNGLLVQAGLGDYVDNYPPDNMKREYPFEYTGRLQQLIYQVYGKRGLQSFGKIGGQKVFQAATARFGAMSRIGQALVRAAPAHQKYRAGLDTVAKSLNNDSDVRIEVDENERFWIWRVSRCYMCYGWHAEEAVCHPLGGMVEAMFRWMSDDSQTFRVVETECIAKGDAACVFLIEKPKKQ